MRRGANVNAGAVPRGPVHSKTASERRAYISEMSANALTRERHVAGRGCVIRRGCLSSTPLSLRDAFAVLKLIPERAVSARSLSIGFYAAFNNL